MPRQHKLVLCLVLFALLAGCDTMPNESTDSPQSKTAPQSETAGSLVLEGIESGPLSQYFGKRVNVFGVDVVATATTPDDKVLHAAAVMAEYLDNDEDGSPDNQRVVDKMVEQNALLVMFADFDELESSGIRDSDLGERYRIQDLEGHETKPEGAFDAALEEVLHLISFAGYAELYPSVFGEKRGSQLAEAMDLARGGYFEEVPEQYPEEGWYHYDDVTCEYECMITEYFYWALTTLLGAQADSARCAEIAVEWEPCTPELLASMDPAVYALLTDPQYAMPVVLPDGDYEAGTLEGSPN